MFAQQRLFRLRLHDDEGNLSGAAFVFLMTGPATNAAMLATIWKILGKRATAIYLITVACTALTSGLLLDYILKIKGDFIISGVHHTIPFYIQIACSVILLYILLVPMMFNKKNHKCDKC
jgi:hypothetical protein